MQQTIRKGEYTTGYIYNVNISFEDPLIYIT